MQKKLSPGTKAPCFKLISSEGREVNLSMFRGKWVILYFYPRAMTRGCTREALRFNELSKEFERLNAIIIGVSTDPVERLKKFKEKYKLDNIILLSDPEGIVVSLYNVLKKSKRPSAKRVTFIISPNGVITEILENIKPAEKHADKALELLKNLSQKI